MAESMHWKKSLAKWNGVLSFSYEHLPLAVLMDIADEMKKLNAVFACRNVQHGFSALRVLARHNEAAFKRRVNDAVRKRMARKKERK